MREPIAAQIECDFSDRHHQNLRRTRTVFYFRGQKQLGLRGWPFGHRAMTSSPTTQTTVEGEAVLLESIPEIITKKIYHRGTLITPRDIFDIAAAGEQHEDLVIKELGSYRNEVTQTLTTLDNLNAEFVSRAIADLAIKDQYKEVAKTALERSKEILRAV